MSTRAKTRKPAAKVRAKAKAKPEAKAKATVRPAMALMEDGSQLPLAWVLAHNKKCRPEERLVQAAASGGPMVWMARGRFYELAKRMEEEQEARRPMRRTRGGKMVPAEDWPPKPSVTSDNLARLLMVTIEDRGELAEVLGRVIDASLADGRSTGRKPRVSVEAVRRFLQESGVTRGAIKAVAGHFQIRQGTAAKYVAAARRAMGAER